MKNSCSKEDLNPLHTQLNLYNDSKNTWRANTRVKQHIIRKPSYFYKSSQEVYNPFQYYINKENEHASILKHKPLRGHRY